MDNTFSSPQTYQHFNDLNYCPNPQCNNNKKGLICLNSNTDTNIITKYDWAVKSLCKECNRAWRLFLLKENIFVSQSHARRVQKTYEQNYKVKILALN